MKKTVFQIIVLSLFLIMGCSKDEMTTDEQELFSLEKNKQTSIGEQRGDGGANGWNFVEFYGTSIGMDTLIICLPESMDCGRKLLSNGYFSGNLPGYGKINSSLSKYTITFRREEPYYFNYEPFPLFGDLDYYALYDDPTIPARFEEFQYKIEIKGKVGISNKDYFNVKITAVILPMVPDESGDIIKGSWISASDVDFTPGLGKLANYSDEYFRCGTRQIEGTNFSGVNLETGEMSLFVNNIHF